METAYIGLGSNLGDSLQVVLHGWKLLGAIPGIKLDRLSNPYRTEPVGMDSENWFINAAGELKTTLSPAELLKCLHRVEEHFGRKRDPAITGYQDRILDLDILLYGQEILADNGVIIPHPSMQNRLFVMLPLCEIASSVRHPVKGQSMCDLLDSLLESGENPVVEKGEWPKE